LFNRGQNYRIARARGTRLCSLISVRRRGQQQQHSRTWEVYRRRACVHRECVPRPKSSLGGLKIARDSAALQHMTSALCEWCLTSNMTANLILASRTPCPGGKIKTAPRHPSLQRKSRKVSTSPCQIQISQSQQRKCHEKKSPPRCILTRDSKLVFDFRQNNASRNSVGRI